MGCSWVPCRSIFTNLSFSRNSHTCWEHCLESLKISPSPPASRPLLARFSPASRLFSFFLLPLFPPPRYPPPSSAADHVFFLERYKHLCTLLDVVIERYEHI